MKNFYESFKVSLIWNIMRISTVKLVFSFCANAKFKDIACIVNHYHHIFLVPWRFYSTNKSCSIVFQLHLITDYVSIAYWVTGGVTPPGGDWLVSNLARNTPGLRFSQLALCIPQLSTDIFTHIILGKYLAATRRPHYNGVSVI